MTKEEFEKIAVDDFLIDDLVGIILYDENGELAGQIMDVVNYGFDDIVVVKCEDERFYEVPFRKAIFQHKGKEISVIRKEFDGAKVAQE